MAADSVLLQSNRGRFVGGNSLGHLHRGHGTVAASSSIPSKYQTFVVDNSEKKGFLSRAKRFQDLGYVNENPGPGTYKDPVCAKDEPSPSYSKHGTGTFASKKGRFNRDKREFAQPGPGEYEPRKLPSKTDFNKASVTSNFHLPIAIPPSERKQRQAPAPNSYKISKATGRVVHDNNVSAYAAFKSNSKRESFINKKNASNVPSPCHYNVKEDLIHKTSSGVTASFKSTTNRKMTRTPDLSPGPASYNPYHAKHAKRKGYKFQRQHYLSISAPALALPDVEPTPGPGHYNLVNYEGEGKRFMSSSMFVSTTSRWNPTWEAEMEIPGPTSYRPRQVGKQSFIYNPSRRWIS
ncbi:O(6)-methylguanine-induced apoptosis 2-like [Dendronephthya gigantea]|uniref:O(6)-methylguanine-induced apoptosis 2-like n=1 Tax=Dendronephthya gigantea TaxID=151771 RepID=UPI00106B36D9|nr:O(6)-methylguanine-induced apoptosis 2-like [Dendronephthya gigantea]